MAIAYIDISFHGRSKGFKAVAGAAYRAGEKLYDQKYDMVHNFENCHHVKHSEILLPKNADQRFSDREYLWNFVEATEKRKDSQFAMDYVLALPRELKLDQQIDLAKRFANYHFVEKGLIADISLHDKEDGNPHAHIYVTTRRLINDRFDKYKARDLMPTIRNGFLLPEDEHQWSEKWRSFQNTYFKDHNINLEVDENHIIPTKHEGRIKSKTETHYLKEENIARNAASIEIALNDPENLLNILGAKYTVFNERVISKTIFRYCESPEEFQRAKAQILAHKDIVSLGIGDDGREQYTTRSNYLLEANMADNADEMLKRRAHIVSSKMANKIAEKNTLNPEQKTALLYLADSSDIVNVVGRAGTGKSYLMRSARELWESEGYTVRGMSISAIAAKNLQLESGIRSSTIRSFIGSTSSNTNWLTEKDVLVIDEAGMVPLDDMAQIVEIARTTKCKLALIGDNQQLQPVGKGAPYRAIIERTGYIELQNIMRQKSAGDRSASIQLSHGRILDALKHYDQKNAINFIKANDENPLLVHQQIVTDWLKTWDPKSPADQLMIAHRNIDVDELNKLARDSLIRKGILKRKGSHIVKSEKGEINLIAGDRLLFLLNNKTLGINNGSFGTVISIKNDRISVRLDGDQEITFSTNEYNHFDYGYAATVHKTQGSTLSRVYVHADGHYWNKHLAYVALTRHKEDVKIYTTTEYNSTISELADRLSQDDIRDNILDFPITYARRRGFDPDRLINKFVDEIARVKTHISDAWLFVSNYQAYLLSKQNQLREHTRASHRIFAKEVATYIDMVNALHVEWKALKSTHTSESLFRDPRYLKLFEKRLTLNKIAFDLSHNLDSLKTVFHRNGFKLKRFETSVNEHKKATVVEQYVNAVKDGHSGLRHRYALQLNSAIKEHYSYITYYSAERGLHVKDITKQLYIDKKYIERCQLLSTLTRHEKEKFRKVERYVNTDKYLTSAWRSIIERDDSLKLSNREKQRILAYTALRDQLAKEISEHKTHCKKAIDFYSIDEEKLQDQVKRHQLRSQVKTLLEISNVSEQKSVISGILKNRDYYPIIHEQGMDWQELWKTANVHQHMNMLSSLSNEDRVHYRRTKDYQQARINAGIAWSQYFRLKDKESLIADAHKRMCFKLNEKRNLLAYDIILNATDSLPYIENSNIPIHDIKKHASKYREDLEKTHEYKKKRTNEKLLKRAERFNKPLYEEKIQNNGIQKRIWNRDLINEALIQMGEEFYLQVLGEPTSRQGNKLRYGRKQSFAVTINGQHKGLWHSFETGNSGTPLSLLTSHEEYGIGLSFENALEEGARIAGLSTDHTSKVVLVQRHAKNNLESKQTQTEDDKVRKSIETARYYYDSSLPINGTLAERYLREIRGIKGDISQFRYHPKVRDTLRLSINKTEELERKILDILSDASSVDTKIKRIKSRNNSADQIEIIRYYPALLVDARNEKGQLTAIHTISLDETANKVDSEKIGVVKRSRGQIKGSAVLVHTGKSSQVILAEGNETAASLITALPDANIYVTLGNISNAVHLGWLAKKHNAQSLYFAADNDGKNANNIKAIHKIAKFLKEEQNIDCHISMPTLPREGKVDFNDLLLESGSDEVKRQVTHFKAIELAQSRSILNKKDISNAFNDIDEEKRLHKLNSTFVKELLESKERLKDPALDSKRKDYYLKRVDSNVQVIYQAKKLYGRIQKLAPSIANDIETSYFTQNKEAMDWFKDEYKNACKALKSCDNVEIQRFLKSYNSVIDDFGQSQIKKHEELKRQSKLIIKSKVAMEIMQNQAPALLKKMMAVYNIDKEHQRGLDR